MPTVSDHPNAKTTIIDASVSRLYNNNNEQEAIISAIEDRLHNFLDRRSPSDDCQNEKTPENQLSYALNFQLGRSERITSRLKDVLSHLSEIV